MESNRLYHLCGLMTAALILISLSSCNPDCKEVTIQKIEWMTRYEDYFIEKDSIVEVGEYIDTLVSYKVVEHRTKVEYRKDSSGETKGRTMVHYISIKNNNKSYSNRFAIKLSGKEYLESSSKWRDLYLTTNYVTIGPQDTYTFTVKHPSLWRNENNGYNEDNVTISILQKASNVFKMTKQTRRIQKKKVKRIDNLVFSDTIVNDCECDIEALAEKYKTIKETFNRLQSEHLIITE